MTFNKVLLLLYLFVDASAPKTATNKSNICELAPLNIETYSRDADVIFGGLISVHVQPVFPANAFLFTEPPGPMRCTKFSTEFYASVLAMVFATEEINRNPNLLPNTTLGFQMYDSCFTDARAIQGTLWMHSGQNKTVPNYECCSKPKLASFIGDTVSAGAQAMARILGVSRYPQVTDNAIVCSMSTCHRWGNTWTGFN